MKIFIKKLEYDFSVQNTKIDNTSFSYKIARSKANVKTNRIVSTKWTLSQRTEFCQ